jgi:CBS domain-containing protein
MISPSAKLEAFKVETLMSTAVPVCQSCETALAALQSMRAFDCSCISVVDQCSVVGVVTARDIAMAALRADAQPSKLPVATIMTDDIFVAWPDMSLAEAEALMRAQGLRRIPVVDDLYRPLGMLDLADITAAQQPPPPRATIGCDDDPPLGPSNLRRA